MTHSTYPLGLTCPEAPPAIKDRNGVVVLQLCRWCGRAEADLREPCMIAHAPPACPRCSTPLGPRPLFLGTAAEGHICSRCWVDDWQEQQPAPRTDRLWALWAAITPWVAR